MTYFITFSCYGAHIHGDSAGSVDRGHNLYGTRLLEAAPRRAAVERGLMNQVPYWLDEVGRATALEAVRRVCLHRGWRLLAAHVRTNHVHVVVDADFRPDRAMNAFKAYASRSLNGRQFDEPDRKRWAHHGSTRWLWKDSDVGEAIRYVVEGQGEPMAVFIADVL